ncbi:hypothetical protein CEUSTIGMA_g6128.t1 [Chlamydomonas eustigma]|uniref:Methyltransferase type 11 domain-containing protein n=1 Tax=Chlamydomonas eustigma TaxID=1157962 RepID=A0A250X7F4_9CHLO|nr:hypothetical protein CEUSTIGMA_g6128.t1 [Chlamydomonas eustigma]|eukprot:GAX78690.1 hypothetical protein CEUSTIGMA_g6128.t1 [Chlamydomonas eustigma]
MLTYQLSKVISTSLGGVSVPLQKTFSSYSNLFIKEDQSQAYNEYRPNYGTDCPKVFDRIFSYVNSGNDLAIDVATGTGQAISPIAAKFTRVLGLDVSKSQVDNATPFPNVEYSVRDAHDTQLPGGEADLVTVAQAMHWLDRPRFYQEVLRLLKPGGTFAVITYDFGVLQVRPADQKVDYKAVQVQADQAERHLNALWHENWHDRMGPYWAAPRKLVDNQYEDMEPLAPYFEDVRREQLEMPKRVTAEQLEGYMTSWSAYVTHKQKHSVAPDPALRLKEELSRVLHNGGFKSQDMILNQTLTLLLGRKQA